MGHHVHYVLFTRGDKGVRDQIMDPEELASMREKEQRCAADALGVEQLEFLKYCDGCLIPTLESRQDAARAIRKYRPDIVVTSDPDQKFGENSINHPDHRYMGQIVVDAFFPGAGNPLYFPDLLAEGLQPYSPRELWLTVTPIRTQSSMSPHLGTEDPGAALSCHPDRRYANWMNGCARALPLTATPISPL